MDHFTQPTVKNNSQLTRQTANPTRLSSLKGKLKNVTKIDTEVLRRQS